MTSAKFKQLNPFELKSAISSLLSKINSVNDIQNCLADFEMLDAQEDKKIISKVLFKELLSTEPEKIPVLCFLLEHFVPKDELITKFWETLKNSTENWYTLTNKHHLSHSTLHRLKHNKDVSTKTLNDLCRILGCDMKDIVRYIPSDKDQKL